MEILLKTHQGVLKKRYKRFFADILWNGQEITAHVPNTGSMKSCLFEGQKCYFTEANDPNRKLKYTLEMLETPTGLVGVNTRWPNELIKKAITAEFLPQWKGPHQLFPEYKINKETRLDFAIQRGEHFHYVEVKNVSLKIGDSAAFPDAVTERGQKHLRELIELKQSGAEAEIVFLIQRSDVTHFRVAQEIDPDYAQELFRAKKAGVRITPLLCHMSPSKIELQSKPLAFETALDSLA